MVPWAHINLPLNDSSLIDSAVFAQLIQLTRVSNTLVQTTLRATSVVIGGIYALRAGYAA